MHFIIHLMIEFIIYNYTHSWTQYIDVVTAAPLSVGANNLKFMMLLTSLVYDSHFPY